MQKVLLILALFCSTISGLFAQKNPARVGGHLSIDKNSAIGAVEVTARQWAEFIINNNFDETLFPNPAALSATARLFFEDLQKKKDFKYIKIRSGAGSSYALGRGVSGYKLTKQFSALYYSDTSLWGPNMPIVGISFAQAQRFCEWSQEVLNKTRTVKLNVTLPSIDLYKKLITNIDSLCTRKCDSCNRALFNYRRKTCGYSTIRVSRHVGIYRCDSYWPDSFGIYNLQGNVAEMTSTEGIAMGGSFRHYAIESYNDKVQHYDKEADWLGFRCLITVQ